MNTTKKKCTTKIRKRTNYWLAMGRKGVKGKKEQRTEIPTIMYKINSYKNTFYYIEYSQYFMITLRI